MPAREVAVTKEFTPDTTSKEGHSGVDLGWLSRTGNKYQPIYVCEDGVVVDVHFNTYRGNAIFIEHKKGDKHFWTGYIHLHKLPDFKKGDKVKRGQQIGLMGNTGKSRGNHLHLYLTKETTKKYSWSNLRSLVIDPLPHLYCDTNLKYEFADDFEPKWYYFGYPEPVARDESVHQVKINSDTRRLRKSPSLSGEIYDNLCTRGIYNVYEIVNADNHRWGMIKDEYWVAIMGKDDEYLVVDYKVLCESLRADINIYKSQKEELVKRLDKANAEIEDLKGDITIYKSQKEVLIDRLEKALSELKGV